MIYCHKNDSSTYINQFNGIEYDRISFQLHLHVYKRKWSEVITNLLFEYKVLHES